ncbi:MAG: DNA polymerase III subunit alpha, partial [Chloroflexia bacterium]|nr:DNA polymerase III subunit alpha [Chloroflexia bacterium]
ALYRPGPLEQIPLYIANKNNPSQIKYLHPILKPILEDTYGVIVYQEQIMQLLQSVADYTLGQAYVVIKAISKKNKALMAENGAIFKAGCLKKGITQQVADELWELILPFAGYSFNRPHATLYGLLSYQTSWLKVNYPVEYMAAVLTGAGGTIEDIAKGALEARRLGVAVLQPDVNASQKGFAIEALNGTLPAGVQFDRGIRFGLAAIKNVGDGPVEVIIAEREANGPFVSLEDLCGRVDRHAINKRVLESLIKGGAFDSLPGSRRQKLAILDQAISAGAEAQKARDVGQSSLFDMFGEATGGTQSVNVPRVPMPNITSTPAEMKEELLWEKELLGLNVSEDPVARALEGVDLTEVSSLSDISEESIGSTMTFVGVLNGVRRITTRKGDTMLVANLEDLTGTIELVAFPRTLAKAGDLLCDDGAVKLTAKVDNRRDVTQLVVESVEPVVAAAQPVPAPIASEMDLEGFGELVEPEAGPGATAIGSGHEPARTTNDATLTPVPPTPPPPTTPITTIRAKQQVKVNGGESRGNGKGNGSASNGGTHHETPTVAQGRTLRLYLPRTGNDEADIRCMQDIYSVLRESIGPDRVTLYLPNGVGTVILQSQHTIQISSGLIDSLKGVIGAERVIAE